MVVGNQHWLVHRSTNPDFTGRREVIDKIIAQITAEDAGNEQRRFVLTGMGGQGKSEICLHVANQVRHRFWGIFWVDASTHNAAEDGFSEIAEALGCEKTIDAVRKKLSNLPLTRQWLLIVDNADDPSRDYQIYLPSGNRGAVLMTSRNAQCGILATAGAHDQLESLEELECIQLLHKTARLSDAAHDTEDHAVTLLQHLGHHTLAILQAGSYIATTHCSISEYLEFFLTNRQRLLNKSRGQGQSRYDTVYATFGASMEFLESQERGSSEETRRDALQLLELFSTFHHTSMPLDIFMDAWEGAKMAQRTPEESRMFSHVLTAWHAARVPYFTISETSDVKLRITDAVARLESLALVRTDGPGRVCRSVSMHPLVHGWAGDRQSQQARKEALRMAECIVSLSYLAVRRRPYFRQFASHLKRLVESDKELVDDAARCRSVLQICVAIVQIFHQTQLHRELYELTGRAFQRLGLDDQEPTAELRGFYRSFAVAVDEEGSRPAQALRAFQAIARLDDRISGENDLQLDRLANMRDLGIAYGRNGQTKEAVALLRDVVKASQGLGSEERHLLSAEHTLGAVLTMDGQNKEAIMLLEKVVMDRQRFLSEDNTERLASEHGLANTYLRDGQIVEATRRLEEVSRIYAQTLGEEHPNTAITQGCLAEAYQQAGRVSEAIALHEQVVNTRTLVLGEKHPDSLSSQHQLASVYEKVDRIQDAIDILERVVRIRYSTLDDTDQKSLDSQHELGRAYLEAGRASKAVDILERVVHIRNSTLDDTDQKSLDSQHELGRAYLETGRASKAIDILERVVDINKSIHGEKHPDPINAQLVLAEAYQKVRRGKEGIGILEQVIVNAWNFLYNQNLKTVEPERLLEALEANRSRDSSFSNSESVKEPRSARSGPVLQPVARSEQDSANDGHTIEAGGQRPDTSRDGL